MTHARRTPASSPLRSLVLLAGLTLGSTSALMAQTTPSPQGPGTPRQSMPLDSDGKATSEQAAQQFSFQRMDTDRDGHLSKHEAQELPTVLSNFEAMDKDGDGKISQKEFLNHSGEGLSTGAGNRSGSEGNTSGTDTGAGTRK